MMQPHGGNPEGVPLSAAQGTEVIFTFLGGDPDRPVIAGVVPDTLNPSPITSANHTKNVIQTGGYNRLEIEDLAGQQRVTLSTPHAKTHLLMGNPKDGHELIAHTEGNSLHHTDIDHDQYVGANCSIAIVANQIEKIGATKKQTVTGDVTHEHLANHQHTTDGNHSHKTGGDHNHQTGGNHTRKTGGNDSDSVAGNRDEATAGNKFVVTSGMWDNVVKGLAKLHFEADKTEKVDGITNEHFAGLKMEWIGGANMETVGGANIETVLGANVETVLGASIETVVGASVETKVGAKVEFHSDKHQFGALKTEALALENKMKGIHDAIVGLATVTGGLYKMQLGGDFAEVGFKEIVAGLSAEEAGLKTIG